MGKISSATVRHDFNDTNVVVHYTRAAHELGLWASERLLIERWFPDRNAPLIEIGCGAGRVTLGLWDLGYRGLTAVDFAEELLDQARSLAALRAAGAIRFLHADATRLRTDHRLRDRAASGPSGPVQSVCNVLRYKELLAGDDVTRERGSAMRDQPEPNGFAGALFMFNGLMQIPGREHRRQALREIRAVCRPDAAFLFTTHDRDDEPRDRPHWAAEAARWARGEQDPRLGEFGDRYFRDDHGGHTFMHLPTHAEVREDLAATGWTPVFDAMRRDLACESQAVRDFSDECRFWVARKE
ncbi:MAG: class I SAM-dependent methyltransferase [Opitutaceae bacterium]|nr:class I SAM-dependent methyltransferase [Opitutaceae bacterium]